MEAVKSEWVPREASAEQKEAVKARRPGRPTKRSVGKSASVLYNTGDESDHEESPKMGV